MYKKLICLAMLVCLALVPGLISHAEGGIRLQHGNNTYTVKQASMPKSGFPFAVEEDDEDDVIILNDKNTGITAEIDLAVMNKDSANALRKYYNDASADNSKLFSNLITLFESYIDAEAENYRINYLYGDGGEPAKESNIKVFTKAACKLYKQDSDVYVYNTIEAAKKGYEENTHIDIFVPIRSAYTILNVNFTMKAGSLNAKSIGIINQMLGCIRISGFSAQCGELQALKDNALILKVNSGIYPGSTAKQDTPEIILEEPAAGFRLKYPAALSQYMQHNLIDGYYYNSFKLSPNEIISISVEPTALSAAAISENEYHDYTIIDKNITTYVRDYLLIYDNHFYRLQLRSTGKRPSAYAISTFSAITDSFEFIPEQKDEPADVTTSSSIYLDEATGISFQYPSGWRLANASTAGGIKLNLPDISDSLDIYVNEGDIANAPYKAMQSKLLFTSHRQEGEISYTYRLVNYIDDTGRGKLCSSVTVSDASITYTMFADVNSNWVKDGRIADAKVSAMLNTIVNSFCIKEIPAKNDKGYDNKVTPLKTLPESGFVFSCS